MLAASIGPGRPSCRSGALADPPASHIALVARAQHDLPPPAPRRAALRAISPPARPAVADKGPSRAPRSQSPPPLAMKRLVIVVVGSLSKFPHLYRVCSAPASRSTHEDQFCGWRETGKRREVNEIVGGRWRRDARLQRSAADLGSRESCDQASIRRKHQGQGSRD